MVKAFSLWWLLCGAVLGRGVDGGMENGFLPLPPEAPECGGECERHVKGLAWVAAGFEKRILGKCVCEGLPDTGGFEAREHRRENEQA